MPSIQPQKARRATDYDAVMIGEFTWAFGPDQAPGDSDYVLTLRQRRNLVLEHYCAPASRQAETVQQKFDRLARQWREETLVLSSILQMSMHPAYQQIIGMGSCAVSLLLRELEREPNHWFWALHAITGVDPVPETDHGNVEAMTEAWLRWGEEQGLLR